MQFIKFMTSGTGRLARVVIGAIIVVLGLLVVQGTLGTIMSIVGLIPIAGGLFDFCLAGAVFGYPLKGSAARAQLADK